MATENLKPGKMNFFRNLKNLWVACLFVGIFLMLSGNVNAAVVHTICPCSDCATCTAQLNNPVCREIWLTANITNHNGTCINNPRNFRNKIFDCKGNTIDGVGRGYGIYTDRKNFNTIRNCVITDFEIGIYLRNSSNNALTNNRANNNRWVGILLERRSSNNRLISNRADNNTQIGISLLESLNNILTTNVANNNSGAGILLGRSSNNRLTGNTVCFNSRVDIVNFSVGSTGMTNRCDRTFNWKDMNAIIGCALPCRHDPHDPTVPL